MAKAVHARGMPRLRVVSETESKATSPLEPDARDDHARRPSPSSFEEAFRRHHGLVCHLLAQYGVAPAAVDDVAQEVFLVVHRKWGSFDGRSAFTKWLVGITRRVAADHRRSRRRARQRREQVPVWRPAPNTPLELVERDHVGHHEDLALREVFVMADVVGMRGPEIAESLGVGLNTVYSRLRLARRRFEAFVAGDETGGTDGG